MYDTFPSEQLFFCEVIENDSPWFAGIANFHVFNVVHVGRLKKQRKKFLQNSSTTFGKICTCSTSVQIKSVSDAWLYPEIEEILSHCHNGLTRG